jgi:hypothetical protein
MSFRYVWDVPLNARVLENRVRFKTGPLLASAAQQWVDRIRLLARCVTQAPAANPIIANNKVDGSGTAVPTIVMVASVTSPGSSQEIEVAKGPLPPVNPLEATV